MFVIGFRNKDMTLALQAIGITKRFPGVLANEHVNFSLERGEIHALLGENGAGKSMLINILSCMAFINQMKRKFVSRTSR
jgi:ABC-type uncharacterized transport system ATPase subunit